MRTGLHQFVSVGYVDGEKPHKMTVLPAAEWKAATDDKENN